MNDKTGLYYIEWRTGVSGAGSGGTFSAYLQSGTEGETLQMLRERNTVLRDRRNEAHIVSMKNFKA
jgi:hypothetical protein